MTWDNYHEVRHQLEELAEQMGAPLRPEKDLPLAIGFLKKKVYGKGGKCWYWLREFKPDAGGCYIVGAYGSYKDGSRFKVDVDWKPLSEAERARKQAERQAAEEQLRQRRAEEARLAALSAADLWHEASRDGKSEYLQRKAVVAEACRYLRDGSIVVPLLRYDLPREEALVGTQRIWPSGRKRFTAGFAKPGASLRLGTVAGRQMLLICEGYATGLSIRMALEQQLPVFVALDAYNLMPVCMLLRTLYPDSRLLICADDDWKTEDHEGKPSNVGRLKAKEVAQAIERVDMVYPVFPAGRIRGNKETDFNDLHVGAGLRHVQAQLRSVIDAIRRYRAAA